MIFRQLFDTKTSTYTYILGDKKTGKALIIDPVLEQTDLYVSLIKELKLSLLYALDTHVHADHITGIGKLASQLHCKTVHGAHSDATGIDVFISDCESLILGDIKIQAIYTPGHTNDSYCFLVTTCYPQLLFTGDTLLIRGTGRTDFQQGDAAKQYDSLFNKLLSLHRDTVIYPGHDYRGMTVSTIGEELTHNPRLQVKNKTEYLLMMNELKLAKPALIDIAVPMNLRGGLGC